MKKKKKKSLGKVPKNPDAFQGVEMGNAKTAALKQFKAPPLKDAPKK